MRLCITLLLSLFIVACSTSTQENNTFYPYTSSDTVKLKEGARIVIASSNFGMPSRNYLEKYEARVDNVLKNYLKENGYNIVSSRLYEEAYNTAIANYGNPYDKFTGKLNSQRLTEVLSTTFASLRQDNTVDVIIFTDLIEKPVNVIRSSSKKFVRFDGVYRKVKVQGTGSGVDENFNWSKPIDATSLSVVIYTAEGQRILHGVGGLDAAEAIDTRKNSFSRSRSILKEDKYIEEGVALALHPAIFSELYKEPKPLQE